MATATSAAGTAAELIREQNAQAATQAQVSTQLAEERANLATIQAAYQSAVQADRSAAIAQLNQGLTEVGRLISALSAIVAKCSALKGAFSANASALSNLTSISSIFVIVEGAPVEVQTVGGMGVLVAGWQALLTQCIQIAQNGSQLADQTRALAQLELDAAIETQRSISAAIAEITARSTTIALL